MITMVMRSKQGRFLGYDFKEHEKNQQNLDYSDIIWIEILNPTFLERKFIEKQENVELPEHHELHQIEFSNQFYQEKGNILLTANLVTVSYPQPENHAISIIVTKNKIITLRYSDPNPTRKFLEKIIEKSPEAVTHYELLTLLIQSLVGQNADILEGVGERTNNLSLILSGSNTIGSLKKRENRWSKTLAEINLLEGLISMTYQSLSSLEMLINYLDQSMKPNLINFNNMKRDVLSLLKHSEYLNQKVVFQLDATLGLINIEQMGIVKIFTVLAMVFMPPTLIASIYGMNFRHMPELDMPYAYLFVLIAIAISAYLPWVIFRKKGWI